MSDFVDLWVSLFSDLGKIIYVAGAWALSWGLVIAWFAWFLCAVNWAKAWPVLRQGAWVGVVLLMVVCALVWSQIAPAPLVFGAMTVGNFWWQLGAVTILTCLTLFAGWLQGVMDWAPAEIDLEPPADTGHAH